MFGVVLLLIVFFLVVILGFGILIGYLLHWMISAVSLEIGILIGVISVACTMYFWTSVMKATIERERLQAEEEEGIDEEEDAIHEKRMYVLPELPLRYVRKRRKKRR